MIQVWICINGDHDFTCSGRIYDSANCSWPFANLDHTIFGILVLLAAQEFMLVIKTGSGSSIYRLDDNGHHSDLQNIRFKNHLEAL